MAFGIALIFAVTLLCGYIGKKSVKDAKDFLVGGGKNNLVMVAAALLSTVVGGSMTVGSAEMGYAEGMFGVWQSLGSSIAMIIMAIVLCPMFIKMRDKTGITTIPSTLTYAYGPKMAPILGFFGFIGVFLSVLAQVKSFTVLLQNTVAMSLLVAIIITAVLFIVFIVFGGIMSTTIGGLIKTILMYIMFVAIMFVILKESDGWSNFLANAAPAYENPNWASPISRGLGSSLGYGMSFTFGMMCTQVYVQGILSAKDPIAARNGCILAAILCAPMGFVCANVGIYMHSVHPEVAATTALPVFLATYFPSIVTGLFMGTMLLNTLASGAGLVLSCSTNLYEDFICGVIKKERTGAQKIAGNRICVALTVLLACGLILANVGDLIMTFVNLSAQIRACTTLIPMIVAGYYCGRKAHESGIAAAIAGGLGCIVWNQLHNPLGLPSLYFGLLLAGACFIVCQLLFAKKYEPTDLRH